MRFCLAVCVLAAAQIIVNGASAGSAHLCVDGSDRKTIRDNGCNAEEHEVVTEQVPPANQGREGQGTVEVTHMPWVHVDPSPPERRANDGYDRCTQLSVPECDEYPPLSSQWSRCRRSTWEWIQQQCVALDTNANFAEGERRRCMKARARAYCLLKDRYEIVRQR